MCMFCCFCVFVLYFFFFKQKTAYEMRISDWSSDVCSSDLLALRNPDFTTAQRIGQAINAAFAGDVAQPLDPGTVQLTVPPQYRGNSVALLTREIGRASCRERVCQYV